MHEQFMEGNQHLIGPVIRMLGTTALRTKSPKHAELFLKTVGVVDVKSGLGEGSDAQTGESRSDVPSVVYNFLIPRPPTPQLEREDQQTKLLPPPMDVNARNEKAVTQAVVEPPESVSKLPPLPADIPLVLPR